MALSRALQHRPGTAHRRLGAMSRLGHALPAGSRVEGDPRRHSRTTPPIHRHVLQDVLARLDKTYQAFFRRLANGEKPGFPRFQGRTRWHSFTFKEYGNGAQLDNGCLVWRKIGRIAVRWSRPIEGTPKTVTVSKEADGWYVCCSCADVATHPLPRSGRETGIDVGLKVFLITADGDAVENPRHHRKAERELQKAQRRVSRRTKGSHRRKQGRAPVRQAAPARPPAARRLPPQDGARPRAAVRHARRGGAPGRQPEPPSSTEAGRRRGLRAQRGQPQGRPQQEHSGRRMAPLPVAPRVQGSMRREASGSGEPGVHRRRTVQAVASVSRNR